MISTTTKRKKRVRNTNMNPVRTKKRHPSLIWLSADGPFVSERKCFLIRGAKKRNWLEGKRLYLGDVDGQTRVFALSVIDEGKRLRAYFLDCITGSLYDPRTGRCMSSYMLTLSNVRKDPRAAEILMTWTPEEIESDEDLSLSA